MDVKEKVIGEIITVLSVNLESENLVLVRNALEVCLHEYDMIPHKDLPSVQICDNEKILRHYYATKKMEGLSDKTLKTYKFHIERFLDQTDSVITQVDTNTVRFYLAKVGSRCSNSYADDARRILSTFFSFCVDEEYIVKNPVKKIKKIKISRTMEAPYSDVEVEKLRDSCISKRETALVDFLFSTGCRREEVTKIKISDINFTERSVLIHGKGNKDRTVMFSARCEKHMVEYINERGFDSEYLFCSEKSPHGKIGVGGLANIVKKIGKRAEVENVHLHRFRKWFGTYMSSRVSLQDLKEMMGHSKIDTTNSYYVYMDRERVKENHKRNAV